LTHVSSRRGSAIETGDDVWGLSVAAHRTSATFVDGAFTLNGKTNARISPWLSMGLRHQLRGRRAEATAAYAGVADALNISGVNRNATLATVGAGASLRLAPGTMLFFGAISAFGADSSGESATAGLRVNF
jgi:uncharacterized protein with beta-barrel porin domain